MKRNIILVTLAVVAFAAAMFINPNPAAAQTADPTYYFSHSEDGKGLDPACRASRVEVDEAVAALANAKEAAAKADKADKTAWETAQAAAVTAKADLTKAQTYQKEVCTQAAKEWAYYGKISGGGSGGGTKVIRQSYDDSSLRSQMSDLQGRLAAAEDAARAASDEAAQKAAKEEVAVLRDKLDVMVLALNAMNEKQNEQNKKSCFLGCGKGDDSDVSWSPFLEATGFVANELNAGYVGAGFLVDTKYFDPFVSGGYAGEGHTGEYEAASGYYFGGGFLIGTNEVAAAFGGRYSAVDFSGANNKPIFENKVGTVGVMYAPWEFGSFTLSGVIGSETTGLNDYDDEVNSATIYGAELSFKVKLARIRLNK